MRVHGHGRPAPARARASWSPPAGDAEFGRIAAGLGERQPETEFQVGLREFSMLLAAGRGALTVLIFVINLVLRKTADRRGAVLPGDRRGHHPAAAARGGVDEPGRRVAAAGQRKVLVKRLVCIEDLGDIDMLFTDKTGTLTEGHIAVMRVGPTGATQRRGAAARAAVHR